MSTHKIDFHLIARLEGGPATRGYVPDAANSHSGVTIATGFDLGQRNLTDLQALGLPQALQERLEPYLGLTGLEAVRYLKEKPLTVSEEEAQLLDECYRRPFIESLCNRYSRASSVAFCDLPGVAQTVIASVAFQYGDLTRRTPNFWKQVTAQDWPAAVINLRNFGDRYPTRRNKEADLLSGLLE